MRPVSQGNTAYFLGLQARSVIRRFYCVLRVEDVSP